MVKVLFVPSGEIRPVNKIDGTGTAARLREALRLWQTGRYEYLILSGGLVSPRSVQTLPDSVIMRDWVLKRSDAPPEDRILAEICARDSFENVANVIALIQRCPFLSTRNTAITIVSEHLHARRLAITFVQGYHWPPAQLEIAAIPRLLTPKETFLERILSVLHSVDPRGTSWVARKNRERRTYATR